MSDDQRNIVPVRVQDDGYRVAVKTKAWAPLLFSAVGLIPLGIWIDEGGRLQSWTIFLAALGVLMIGAGIWMALYAPRLYLHLGEERFLLVRGPRRWSGELAELQVIVSNYLSHMRSRPAGGGEETSLMWRLDLRTPCGEELTYWESGDGPATWRETEAWAGRIGVKVTDATEFDAAGRPLAQSSRKP